MAKSAFFLPMSDKPAHHARAAEQLGLQPVALRALPHQPIEQQLHQMHAEPLGFAAARRRRRPAAESGSCRRRPPPDRGCRRRRRSRAAWSARRSGSSLTLNSPWTMLMRCSATRPRHVRRPTTASIAARIVLVVKGLAMKLLSPICRPRSTSDLSGLPVTRMKPIFAVGALLAQRLQQPEPVEIGHVLIGDHEMHRLDLQLRRAPPRRPWPARDW